MKRNILSALNENLMLDHNDMNKVFIIGCEKTFVALEKKLTEIQKVVRFKQDQICKEYTLGKTKRRNQTFRKNVNNILFGRWIC